MSKRRWNWWSKEEVSSWGTTSKRCRTCNLLLDCSEFHKMKRGLLGLSNDCKNCRKPVSRAKYASWNREYKLYTCAKSRARLKKREFTIALEDIIIPEICPILGITMDNPSIDRVDSAKGYSPDNIQIVSLRANVLKNNGTIDEFRKIIQHLESLQ